MAAKVVLVTGVGGQLAGSLVARLATDPDIERIIGVDTVAPSMRLLERMGRAEFVRADIRNPLIAKVISNAKVDTVVHASCTAHPAGPGRRTAIKEMNVIGTMQLLAACQRSPQVRRLVVKSTAAVYGASSRAPAVFDEDANLIPASSSGYSKDAVEVEGYVRGFARRRPDVDVTVARFTNLIGPAVDTVLTRYFALPVTPSVFGSDARMQLLHSDDALAVLERATLTSKPGVFNVAGDGVLTLSQAIRRARRVELPVPKSVLPMTGRMFRGLPLVDFSADQLQLLSFGRVVDTTRLKRDFGYTPGYTTGEAFDDYVTGRALRPTVNVSWLRGLERRLGSVRQRTGDADTGE
ncbi:UDP-glucose 4-epimerase [Tamaricihabitans halophyticus]|uniref:UDP-glucose 4-epimerase n=1 Tax=Tamaricihabitans halophyticus TaxID=1262583 RepID=A0A4V2SU44_9PSEU|nr:NAD-dependent epimerase/dehydratase family protein [Tamaricihabitans halophyticus]TCP53096.1 UDP-glucose 4-epimerase [Tamaricihabitans halophyticus]